MKVKKILETKESGPVTVSESNTITEAIELMNKNKIGSLLVLDSNNKLIGIITERDILHVCGKRIKLIHKTKVKKVMSTNLIIGVPDDDIEYLMGVMSQNRIRHLPIIDNENIAGIISIVDIVEYQLKRAEFKNRYMEEYIQS